MSDRDALESFVGKWRVRWPEWAVAEAFVPRDQRVAAAAWMSLLQELTDAAWGGSDPRPGEAKLGWWAEELQGWPRGMRRHPLGQVLQSFPAPWAAVAAALPPLRDSRERPIDATEASAQLGPLAAAASTVEQVLFDGPAHADRVIVASLLHMRLAHHPADAAPLQVLARAGEGGALDLWSRQLASQGLPGSAARPRRVLAALGRARLQRGEPVQPLPLPRALWVAWRAARA